MGFLLFIFAVSLFSILKHVKLNDIIIKNVFNQIIFHFIEGTLILYTLYLMNKDDGYIFSWIFLYFFMFLPLSIYKVRYGDDDEKYKKTHNKIQEVEQV